MVAGSARDDLPRRRARRVAELTRQMVRCSREADWDGVVERNRLRHLEAEALFQSGFPAGDNEYIRSILEEALSVEREVRERMTAARDELGVEARSSSRHYTASNVYRRFSGSAAG